MDHRSIAIAGALVVALAAAPYAPAQTFIKGRVFDGNGVGVGSVDIDGFDDNGDALDLSNDGTLGDGTFLTGINDGPGTYDFVFNPPQGSPLLPEWRNDVVCIGTIDLGTITLQDGNLVSGRVVDANGQPLSPVRIHPIDEATNQEFFVRWNETDSLGNFLFALPDGTFTLEFDPSSLAGPLTAPGQLFGVVVNGATDVGDVALPPGFVLSATCHRPNGTGLANVNLDVLDSASHVKLFTPGDNSDSAGFVDVVVPGGTFDVRFKPSLADKLVGIEVVGVGVGAATDLGTKTFQAGFYVSGTVTDTLGAFVSDTDVDVHDSATGVKIYTPGDNTDGNGFYKIVVPSGTWDVEFTPPYTMWLRSKVFTSVGISADKVQNATLDPCPAPSHYGNGTAGSGGFVPTLESVGDPPRLGAPDFELQIANGLGGSHAMFVLSTGSASIPLHGFTLYVDPAAPGFFILVLPLGGTPGLAGAGSITIGGSIPYDLGLDGLHLYMQAVTLDPGGAFGRAATDGLDVPLTR